MLSQKMKKVFDLSIDAVFSLILVLIIIGIAVGAVQLLKTLWHLLAFKGITGHYTPALQTNSA